MTTLSDRGRAHRQKIIQASLETYPHMVHSTHNSNNWCWANVAVGEWGCYSCSEDGYYYFFKDQAKAVEFALKCL